MNRLIPADYPLVSTLRHIKWGVERALGKRLVNFMGKGQINFIDVGALGWLPHPWSLWKHTMKIDHLLRFEPQERNQTNNNITTVDTVLWSEPGRRDFYIYSPEGAGASLYKQNYGYVKEHFEKLRNRGSRRKADTWFARSQIIDVETVTCRTLDGVIEDLDQDIPYHFLKIDAQGAEYEILKGAEGVLTTSCLGLQLELFEFPILKGITLLPEVEEYLSAFNFRLAKKISSGATFDAAYDCLFLKESDQALIRVIQEVYNL